MRVSATVLLSVALSLAGAPAASALGSLPDKGVGIVFVPDGNLWHTTKGSLGATSLSGKSFNIDLPGDADAGALAIGGDGALWFIHSDDALGRLAAGGMPTVIGDLPVKLNDLTAGPDGNLWFAAKDEREGGGRGVIGRVTPGGGLTLFGDGVTGEPQAIAAGDGALWFTEPKAGRLGRITTDGAVTELPVGGRPTALAVGSDLAVWFTDARGSIGRVAPDRTVTRYDDAGRKPGEIALGADGQLWYTLQHGIGQVRTDGTITTWDLGPAAPVSIAGGPDAAMYYTDADRSALGRFDIRTEPGTDPPKDKGKPDPEPELNETAVVAPEAGEVRVRTPDGSFTALDATRAVPLGSVVDTRQGTVTLVTETAEGDQSGSFRGGLFKVRQRRRGHTEVHLRGRLDCSRGTTATTSRKRRKKRRIWGSDAGGAFSTHGLDSVTTVRGTEWLTVDTCRGTRTRVKSGEVVVRSKRTGRRYVVRAGESHFVRHRR